VQRHALAEEVFDFRVEGLVVRLHEGFEDQVTCLQTAGERAGIQGLREGGAVFGDEVEPEGFEVVSLLDADISKIGIKPRLFVVAIQKRYSGLYQG
jgi:hypothetical protein